MIKSTVGNFSNTSPDRRMDIIGNYCRPKSITK